MGIKAHVHCTDLNRRCCIQNKVVHFFIFGKIYSLQKLKIKKIKVYIKVDR